MLCQKMSHMCSRHMNIPISILFVYSESARRTHLMGHRNACDREQALAAQTAIPSTSMNTVLGSLTLTLTLGEFICCGAWRYKPNAPEDWEKCLGKFDDFMNCTVWWCEQLRKRTKPRMTWKTESKDDSLSCCVCVAGKDSVPSRREKRSGEPEERPG